MARRFYNPGTKINEIVKFDHPTNDIKDQNIVSYWPVLAEAKSFFDVPTEVSVPTLDGDTTQISVRIADIIRHDYKHLGVVMIDPSRDIKKKPIGDEENIALNEKDAKEKGDRIWLAHLYELVRDHERTVMEIKAKGSRPERARGNVAFAFKTLGIKDPANDVEDVLQREQDGGKVSALEAQLAQMQADMAKLVANMSKGK